MVRLALFFALVSLSSAYPSRNYGRITGGNNAIIEDHPYQVSIQYFGKQICGGVIVSEEYVLTAAQCLPPKNTNPNFVIMRVGTTNRMRDGFSYETLEWTAHPSFRVQSLDMNIGVYKTKNTIAFAATVQAIALITKEEYPQNGDILTISGWGQTELPGGQISEILQEARIPKLSQELCRLASRKADFIFTENMLCAGGGIMKSNHVGDFGGPIVNANKKLVGIACGTPPRYNVGHPSLFTDITSEPIQKFIARFVNVVGTSDRVPEDPEPPKL